MGWRQGDGSALVNDVYIYTTRRYPPAAMSR